MIDLVDMGIKFWMLSPDYAFELGAGYAPSRLSSLFRLLVAALILIWAGWMLTAMVLGMLNTKEGTIDSVAIITRTCLILFLVVLVLFVVGI